MEENHSMERKRLLKKTSKNNSKGLKKKMRYLSILKLRTSNY